MLRRLYVSPGITFDTDTSGKSRSIYLEVAAWPDRCKQKHDHMYTIVYIHVCTYIMYVYIYIHIYIVCADKVQLCEANMQIACLVAAAPTPPLFVDTFGIFVLLRYVNMITYVHSCCLGKSGILVSMDWIKGKFTGKPHI